MSLHHLGRPIYGLLALLLLPSLVNAFECINEKDEFKGTESIKVTSEIDFNASPSQIVIVYTKSGDVETYAVVGLFVFDDWKFLGDEAYDSNKTKMAGVNASRRVLSGGSVLESVQISVSKSYLQDHSSSGISLRIYGKAGNADMTVSASMISDFLSCLSANQ